MRIIVVASGEKDWFRRIGFRGIEVPTLLWVAGPNSIAESHRLSALLSERGLPNRWLPLYRRPALLHQVLSRPWSQTQIHTYLQQVPLLVLSDTEAHLKALWTALRDQGLPQETLFLVRHYRHPLFQEGPIPLTPETNLQWTQLYEDLIPDLDAAAAWQPCKLTPTLA